MTAYTFEAKQTAAGKFYCRVIKGGQVVFTTKRKHDSSEAAKAEARRALTLAYQVMRATA